MYQYGELELTMQYEHVVCSHSTIIQVILAGTLIGLQGDIRCKLLVALSSVTAGTGQMEGCSRRKCVLAICSLK